MDFEIRGDRRPQGRRKLSQERATYSQLMRQGLNNEEACRIAGINPKIGRRWRNGHNPSGGNKAASPINAVVPPRASSQYLCESDRIHIADRLRERATIRTIAAELDRSPSTISREVRRNRHPGRSQYRPFAAQARADTRRPRPKPRKVARTPSCGPPSKLDSVGDLGVSRYGSTIDGHARIVPPTDAAVEVPVVPSPPFR